MTTNTVETIGGRGGDGEGLCGSAMNASAGVGLGDIMARKRPDPRSIQQMRRLRMSGQAIGSSERPMAVVGQRLSRRSRMKG